MSDSDITRDDGAAVEFAEKALKAGCIDARLAWVSAHDLGLLDKCGVPDLVQVKANCPTLFENRETPAPPASNNPLGDAIRAHLAGRQAASLPPRRLWKEGSR